MADTKHEITIRQIGDNSGRNFLIGLATVWLILHFWLDGTFENLTSYFSAVRIPGGEGGFEAYNSGSVTAVVLPIVFKVVAAIGGVASLLLSGLWYAVVDFVSGVYQSIRAWQAKNAAIAEATTAATNAAVSTATTTAVTGQDDTYSIDDLVEAMHAINDELEEVKAKVEAGYPSTPPPTSRSASRPRRASTKRLDKSEEVVSNG